MGFTDPHFAASIISDFSPSALGRAITKALLTGFYRSLLSWVANGASSLVGVLGNVVSKTTEPVLSEGAFRSEFDLMAMLSAAVALPLVAVGAIQAIIRQEPGGLLKSVLVRLPMALLFTGVSVQLVALGLDATDQASALLIGAGGDPTRSLLTGLVTQLAQPSGLGLAAFGDLLLVLTAAIVAFFLWLELAVRSAAIAAASLFLPLALIGLAWPATAHWARRLGETLAALVLSKLVIAAVLALAAGLLVNSSGDSGVVEGVALLAIAAFSPFSLLKLIPVVEAGAIGHLEGLSRRPLRAGAQLAAGQNGAAFLANLAGPARSGGTATGGSGQPDAGRWGPDRSPPTGSGGGGPLPPLDQDSGGSVDTGPGPSEVSTPAAPGPRVSGASVPGSPPLAQSAVGGASPVTSVMSSAPMSSSVSGPDVAGLDTPTPLPGSHGGQPRPVPAPYDAGDAPRPSVPPLEPAPEPAQAPVLTSGEIGHG